MGGGIDRFREDHGNVEFSRNVEDRRIEPREDLLPFPTVVGCVRAREDHICPGDSLHQLSAVTRIGFDMDRSADRGRAR